MQPEERVASFSFSMKKLLPGEEDTEDMTQYLDVRMCQARTNKQIVDEQGSTVQYVFRKVKIGTWAKTSLREEAHFVLRLHFSTTLGRKFTVDSPSFEVFSHQSQLPDRRNEKRTATMEHREVLQKRPRAPEDTFGLTSLCDAMLKTSGAKVDAESDMSLKRQRLLERANDLAVRIAALQEEEASVRAEIDQLSVPLKVESE